MPPEVQIYGQFSDYWSNANVSRGLAIGLSANNVDVQIHSQTGNYCGLWRRGIPSGWGTDAPTGLFVGYPPQGANFLAFHVRKVGAFIAESQILPDSWSFPARKCDLIVVPSRYVRRVYLEAGIVPDRVMVVPHGIHPVYGRMESRIVKASRRLRFLHVAGARDFLDRKGTPQLVQAFANVFGRGRPDIRGHLTIRTPPSKNIYRLIGETGRGELFSIDPSEKAKTPEAMRQYYYHHDGDDNAFAALIQPSRAEAFGICLVEARALGLPVVATHCTGHSQHAEPWDTVVEHGPPMPIAVNGIPNGLAPSVEAEAIEAALIKFVRDYREISHRAAGRAFNYAERYDWLALVAPLARRLQEDAPRHVARLSEL